jgi:hypothetical protein
MFGIILFEQKAEGMFHIYKDLIFMFHTRQTVLFFADSQLFLIGPSFRWITVRLKKTVYQQLLCQIINLLIL